MLDKAYKMLYSIGMETYTINGEERVHVALAVRSRQGTVHLMGRLLKPGQKLTYCNNVICNQRLGGDVIAQGSYQDVLPKVTCERCNPKLREGGK